MTEKRSLRLLADDVFKLVMGDAYNCVWPVEHLRAWEKLDDACTEVELDAARYRWLRERPHLDIAACWLLPKDTEGPDAFDSAIDAAMAAGDKA